MHLVVLRHLTQLTRLKCVCKGNGFWLDAAVMWAKLRRLTLITDYRSIVLSPEWQAPKLQYIHLHGHLLHDDPDLYFHPAYFPRLVHVGLGGVLAHYLYRGLPPSVCSLALGGLGLLSQTALADFSGIRLLDINNSNGCFLVLSANLEILLLNYADVILDSRLCKPELQIIVNEWSRLSWLGHRQGNLK